jgi:dTDP-glucose pyrophosphorylase
MIDSSAPINIVIPMAGGGSRFVKEGYALPKPLINVAGKPMIARVMENLAYPGARYILIARAEHVKNHQAAFEQLCAEYNIELVTIDLLTEGAAATVLFARRLIDNDTPLLTANCDQIIDGGCKTMIEDFLARKLDGSVMVFEDTARDPKWSFVRTDAQGMVVEAREKKPISSHATVGLYMFGKGSDFVETAIEMIIRNDRSNNEFYICPIYNYLVAEGRKIGIYEIEFEKMHGIGTPDDLKSYLATDPFLT